MRFAFGHVYARVGTVFLSWICAHCRGDAVRVTKTKRAGDSSNDEDDDAVEEDEDEDGDDGSDQEDEDEENESAGRKRRSNVRWHKFVGDGTHAFANIPDHLPADWLRSTMRSLNLRKGNVRNNDIVNLKCGIAGCGYVARLAREKGTNKWEARVSHVM